MIDDDLICVCRGGAVAGGARLLWVGGWVGVGKMSMNER
jgi:hypothetical protein